MDDFHIYRAILKCQAKIIALNNGEDIAVKRSKIERIIQIA